MKLNLLARRGALVAAVLLLAAETGKGPDGVAWARGATKPAGGD